MESDECEENLLDGDKQGSSRFARPPEEVSVSITALTKRGVGRGVFYRPKAGPDPVLIEIPGTLAGEEVLAEVGGKKKGTRVGSLLQVIRSSPSRVPARCIHVPDCGGCSVQQLDYASQLKWKEAKVAELFSPLLKGVKVEMLPILPSENQFAYRNKMEYSFSQSKDGQRYLGLVKVNSKGRVIDIKECHLVGTWHMDVLTAMRKWWEGANLDAYFDLADRGSLRNLTLREGIRTKDRLVMLTVSGNPAYALKQHHLDSFAKLMMEVASKTCEGKVSVFLRIHQAVAGSPTQFFEMHLGGSDHFTEKLQFAAGGKEVCLDLKVSPSSFLQPNTLQSEKLYQKAIEWLALKGDEVVFDLYCGTATMGMACCAFARKVVAIEINPYAVCDAKENKVRSKIDNLDIYEGDVGKVLRDLKSAPGFSPPDVVLVDPPRIGLDDRAIDEIVKLSPRRIVYVSCNPQSQVENIGQFVEKGYRLEKVMPVDQFPHTPHVENLALLIKG